MPTAAAAGTVTLAWDANTETNIVGYTILYGTSSRTYNHRLDIGNVTTYTVDTGGPGTFYFAVCARNASATSDPSAEVSINFAAPLTNPVMSIDFPLPGQIVGSDFLISGWAADLKAASGSGVDAVHVYAYPAAGGAPTFLGVASYGSARGDIAAAFGGQFINSGFSLPITGLAPGSYDIVAFAHSTITSSFSVSRVARTTVAVPLPISGIVAALDTPVTNANVRGALTVGGWAFDLRSTSGTGVDRVDVWGYQNPGSGWAPVYLGMATYGSTRADVGGVFGSRFTPSGYTLPGLLLPAGTWDVVVLFHSSVTNAYDRQRVVRITVQPAIITAIDSPAPGATVASTFTVAGWSLDLRATTNSGIDAIHAWAYPVAGGAARFAGVATVGAPRADVAAMFGAQYLNSGYSIPASGLPPGVYDLTLYSHSSVTGQFDAMTVVRITVQ